LTPDAKTLKKVLGKLKPKDTILLYVEREGNSFFIAFKAE
jgi:hypothetical protein